MSACRNHKSSYLNEDCTEFIIDSRAALYESSCHQKYIKLEPFNPDKLPVLRLRVGTVIRTKEGLFVFVGDLLDGGIMVSAAKFDCTTNKLRTICEQTHFSEENDSVINDPA